MARNKKTLRTAQAAYDAFTLRLLRLWGTPKLLHELTVEQSFNNPDREKIAALRAELERRGHTRDRE